MKFSIGIIQLRVQTQLEIKCPHETRIACDKKIFYITPSVLQ